MDTNIATIVSTLTNTLKDNVVQSVLQNIQIVAILFALVTGIFLLYLEFKRVVK